MKELYLTQEQAALGFAAAGSEARLGLLVRLVRAGPSGLSVGDLQEASGLKASTMAHHLRGLVEAGLVEQERQGRTIISRARFERLRQLADFLLEQCCADAPDSEGHHQAEHAKKEIV
ncbi:MAG: ArsR/SmtB family transcription factor [Magnetovibrionaceae bacterium]